MKQESTYYAIIPASVRYDNTLTDSEKLLYGEITCLTHKTGKCFANNKYFANLYGVSKETISRRVSKLKKRGYITVMISYKPNSKEVDKRYIQIHHDPIDRNEDTPIDANVKDNNTSINNTSIIDENNYLENKGFKFYWDEFLATKKKKKASLKSIIIQRQFDKLIKMSKGDFKTACQILERTVNNGWIDFYESKEPFGAKKEEPVKIVVDLSKAKG